jgi:hypothetical protein
VPQCLAVSKGISSGQGIDDDGRPIDQLVHCLALTQPELILVDPERADLLDGVARQLYKHGVGKVRWSSLAGRRLSLMPE